MTKPPKKHLKKKKPVPHGTTNNPSVPKFATRKNYQPETHNNTAPLRADLQAWRSKNTTKVDPKNTSNDSGNGNPLPKDLPMQSLHCLLE